MYTRDPHQFRLAVWQNPDYPAVLVEGDSWADHPLVPNLSWNLHQYLGHKVNILNISQSGDLVFNMAHGKQFNTLKAYLASSHFDFDLLLLSGGGNDILVNDQPEFKLERILKPSQQSDPRFFIDEGAWKASLDRVELSYVRILDAAKDANPHLKIHGHCYDYIYPRDKGADIIVIPDALGPWVYPVMQHIQVTDQQLQRNIIKCLLDDFAAMLGSLKARYPQFDFSNTLGILPDHSNWDLNLPNWDDEIHPNGKGFAKLVNERVGPDVKARLPA